MAITLDISGVLQSAAFWVSNRGGSNGRKLFLYFYLLLTVISVILGNDPVILTGTVFLVYYTRVTEVSKKWDIFGVIIFTLVAAKPHSLVDIRVRGRQYR